MTRFGKSVLASTALAWMALPALVYGAVWISEIHYSPEGSDSGYEWVEWYNTSNEDLDLSEYRFREQGVNHTLSVHQGSFELEPGEYVVVADDAEKFLSVYPEYTATLLDSSFSLRNSGESVEVLDPTGSTVFSVSYDPETGGDGNGHSIGLVDDVWYEVYASPGAANEVSSGGATSTQEASSTATSSASTTQKTEETDNTHTTPATDPSPATYIEIKNPQYEEKTIRADAGGDRVVMAGAAYWFSGRVYGLAGGPLENPRVRWNWGDGSTGEGLTDRHTYRYPGEYTLVLSATMRKYTSQDRVRVVVIPPALSVGMETHDGEDVLTVHNNSRYTLELSHYLLSHGGDDFAFPPASFINPDQVLRIAPETSGLAREITQEVTLKDAYGEVIDRYDPLREALALQVHEANTQEEITQEASSSAAGIREEEPPVSRGGTHSVAYAYPAVAEEAPATPRAVAFDERPSSQSSRLPTPTPPLPSQSAQLRGADVEIDWRVWLLFVISATLVLVYLRYSIVEQRQARHLSGFTITDEDGEKMV